MPCKLLASNFNSVFCTFIPDTGRQAQQNAESVGYTSVDAFHGAVSKHQEMSEKVTKDPAKQPGGGGSLDSLAGPSALPIA